MQKKVSKLPLLKRLKKIRTYNEATKLKILPGLPDSLNFSPYVTVEPRFKGIFSIPREVILTYLF